MNANQRDTHISHSPAPWPPVTRAERDRLRDRALAEAPILRGQAIAALWHDADTLLVDAIDHGRRAAARLAARLRQHAKRHRDNAVAGEL